MCRVFISSHSLSGEGRSSRRVSLAPWNLHFREDSVVSVSSYSTARMASAVSFLAAASAIAGCRSALLR